MEDRCICCGEIVPEGRMVCPICEAEADEHYEEALWSGLLEEE